MASKNFVIDSKPIITDESEKHLTLVKYGLETVPIVYFTSETLLYKGKKNVKLLGEKFHLTFKMVHTECMLVKSLLTSYGFLEVHPDCPDFNLTWSNSHIKSGTLNSLTEYQKINHFPRSFELTRKDRLYRNLHRMQLTKGEQLFDFIPQSFLIPGEYKEFCNEYKKWKGVWIVKPLALSRGRGIFIISRLDELPVEEPLLVAKYIDNPFLINGYKFDLRLYVAVTSFDPLVIYIYKEGLTRFATEKYKRGTRFLGDRCMHLTNYSVNRHNANYTRCYDPNVEDYGNKWSLSALFCYLQKQGFKTSPILAKIKDIVVKSLISAESVIAAGCKIEIPYHGNCFELFGFDILIDENLQPWLLEINFSPSLACDLPLDLKIKSKLIANLFTLTGIVAHDPLLLRFKHKRTSGIDRNLKCTKHLNGDSASIKRSNNKSKISGMSLEEKIILNTQEELKRTGDFLCIFPSANSWGIYGDYFEKQGYNFLLYKILFPPVGRFVLSAVCKSRLFGKRSPKTQDKKQSSKLNNAKKLMFSSFNSSLTSDSLSKSSSNLSEASSSKQLSKGSSVTTLDACSVESELSSDTNSVIYLLKMDETLSQAQARRVFALYLFKVGQRLEFIMKDNNLLNLDRQSAADFEQQMDLVMQFLIYASGNLLYPVAIITPGSQLALCEQGQMVIEQLHKFLESYNHETKRLEKIADSDNREYFVDKMLFKQFIESARAAELEEALMIVARHHSTSWFLGSKQLSSSGSSYLNNKIINRDFRRFQRIFTSSPQTDSDPSSSFWDTCPTHSELRRTASSPTSYNYGKCTNGLQPTQGNGQLRRAKSSIYRTVRIYNPKNNN